MDAKKLKGLAVIAVHDGEKIGTIDNVLFDLERRRVQAYTVSSGGFLGGSHGVIEHEAVQTLGDDALLVANRQAIGGRQSNQWASQYPDLGQITSLRAVTDAGSYAGNLATVRIDEYTGNITDLEITRAGITGSLKAPIVVPIDQVISIGRDVVVVPDAVIQTAPPPEHEQPAAPGETETAPPV